MDSYPRLWALMKRIGYVVPWVLAGLIVYTIDRGIEEYKQLCVPHESIMVPIESKTFKDTFSSIDLDSRLQVHRLHAGESFFSIAKREGYLLSEQTRTKLMSKKYKKLRHVISDLQVGDALWYAVSDKDRQISNVTVVKGEEEYQIDLKTMLYKHQVRDRRYKEYKSQQVEVSSSFMSDLVASGIPQSVVWKIIDIFSWDVDWSRQVKRGMKVAVTFVQESDDPEKSERSYPLKVELDFSPKKKLQAFFCSEKKIYVDEHGKYLRKGFIRNPVNFDRISSKFDLNRKHPILHTIRAHKGVDYAAKVGTPVKATGDGIVIFSGVRGGYGNVVEIQHGQQYSTLYAHLHTIGRSIKKGAIVKQGQKIGTVGMSGLATGPHLHYEFRIAGQHHDPLTVNIPSSGQLNKRQRQKLAQDIRQYNYLERSTIVS